jgi:hypothetical protein
VNAVPEASLPLVWRIPPWQPAGLLLLTAVLAALDIYGDLNLGALLMTAVIALAAFVGAVFALRFLFVADEDGIWVRGLFKERLVEWDDVARVELTTVRHNSATIRITRSDDTFVDVPPSLLLPAKPTSIPKVRSMLHAKVLLLGELVEQQRPKRR